MIAPHGQKEKISRGDYKTITFGASAALRTLYVDEDDQQTVLATDAAPIRRATTLRATESLTERADPNRDDIGSNTTLTPLLPVTILPKDERAANSGAHGRTSTSTAVVMLLT